jgi:hypothetical protein
MRSNATASSSFKYCKLRLMATEFLLYVSETVSSKFDEDLKMKCEGLGCK